MKGLRVTLESSYLDLVFDFPLENIGSDQALQFARTAIENYNIEESTKDDALKVTITFIGEKEGDEL